MSKVDVVIEATAKRAFANAVAWPGWCRAGKTEADALDALLSYADRYRVALGSLTDTLKFPRRIDLIVVERLEGNATTDFGSPARPPSSDQEPVTPAELRRLTTLLRAAWATFDDAYAHTKVELRTGPRGGGRDLDAIREHVADAEHAYLTKLGGVQPADDAAARMRALREAFLDAAEARARGEIDDVGPRGGIRWTAPEAIRRSAWHALDHAWEIEDRRT